MAFDWAREAAEMRSEQVRAERDHLAADAYEERRATRSSSDGFCSPGGHQMVPDGRGGGVCPCGFTVDRDEL